MEFEGFMFKDIAELQVQAIIYYHGGWGMNKNCNYFSALLDIQLCE